MASCSMGFDSTWAGSIQNACLKRKFRWRFFLPGVNDSLPCSRGNRPGFNFREIEIQHLNEIIYFPGKPEFKQISLTMYDIKQNEGLHPIMQWIANAYDPMEGTWMPSFNDGFRKQDCHLDLYDGCGTIIESWQFDSCWPQAAEFGELDMNNMELVTCDVTLRFDRAYSTQS
jgi:hypothetical protein